MAFDSTKLREELADSNPASPAYFELSFGGIPRIFQANGAADQARKARGERSQGWENNFQDFKYRCSEADLPSRQLMTQERRYHGPQRLIPYGVVYSTLNVNLIEGKNLRMRELFDAWQDSIFTPIGTRGDMIYRPQYYDDVVTDLYLDVYSKDGALVRTYTFTDVFPVSVNPSQLSWSSTDQVMTIPIEFSYHEFIGSSKWDNTTQKGSTFVPRNS